MVLSTTFQFSLEDGRSATIGCEHEEAAQGARLVAGGACGRGRPGPDRTYISGIERKVKNPTVTVIERVAVALMCGLGDLLD